MLGKAGIAMFPAMDLQATPAGGGPAAGDCRGRCPTAVLLSQIAAVSRLEHVDPNVATYLLRPP